MYFEEPPLTCTAVCVIVLVCVPEDISLASNNHGLDGGWTDQYHVRSFAIRKLPSPVLYQDHLELA